ncbi:fibronectin type III domain-containing protein, partial [Rhodopirellula bahusiensis]
GAAFILRTGATKTVYQDRSATPATAAEIGDPVGTIVGDDGTYFAIAPSDGARGTLREDDAGNLYIEGTPGTTWYEVEDDLGAGLVLPAAGHSAVFGGVTAGVVYGVCGSANRGTPIFYDTASGSTVRIYGNSGLATVGKDVSAVVPNVVRATYQLSGYSIRVNGNLPTDPVTDTVMLDYTSSTPNRLSLMTRKADAAGDGPTRFYGGVWIPSVMSDTDLGFIEAEIQDYLVPTDPADDQTPVTIDFTTNDLEWNEITRALGDLTDNADGSYTLDYTNWVGPEYVFQVDYHVPDWTLHAADTFVIELNSAIASEKIQLNAEEVADHINPAVNGTSGVTGFGPGNNKPQEGLQRVTVHVRPGQPSKIYAMGLDAVDSSRNTPYVDRWTEIVLHEDFDTGNVHRFFAQSGTFTDSEAADIHKDGVGLPVHILGDSFVGFTSPTLPSALVESASELGFLYVSDDGVGGSNLTEQLARYTADTDGTVYDRTLIVADGALETAAQTQQEVLDVLEDMQDLLDGHARFIYLESNPVHPIGDSRRITWEAYITAIKAEIGGDYEETLNVMQCRHGDTTDDIDAVGDGLYPDSMTSDGTHLNATSALVWGDIMRSALLQRGYLTGLTQTVPSAPQNFAEDTLDLSWDLPNDEGYDPTREFTVYVEDSPGAGTFTEAYSGALRRHTLSGLTSGSWKVRVTATNKIGEGIHSEITVTVS